MYQSTNQSVNSFKSYRANKLKSTGRQPDIQTDTFAKTIFSGSKGLKTWTFDKNGGGAGQIIHISNIFSNENVIKNCDFRPKNERYEKMLKSKIVHLKEIYNFHLDHFLIKRTVFNHFATYEKNVKKQNCSFQKDLQILFGPFFDKMHSFCFNRDKYC